MMTINMIKLLEKQNSFGKKKIILYDDNIDNNINNKNIMNKIIIMKIMRRQKI